MITYSTKPHTITFDTSGSPIFYSPESFTIWYYPSYTSTMNLTFKVEIKYSIIDSYNPTIKEKLNMEELNER